MDRSLGEDEGNRFFQRSVSSRLPVGLNEDNVGLLSVTPCVLQKIIGPDKRKLCEAVSKFSDSSGSRTFQQVVVEV